MAASNTVTKRFMNFNGKLVEEGTWTSAGGTTTVTVTPATSGQGISAGIRTIDRVAATSNGNTGVFINTNPAGVSQNSVAKLTFTANDSGTYTIEGDAA